MGNNSSRPGSQRRSSTSPPPPAMTDRHADASHPGNSPSRSSDDNAMDVDAPAVGDQPSALGHNSRRRARAVSTTSAAGSSRTTSGGDIGSSLSGLLDRFTRRRDDAGRPDEEGGRREEKRRRLLFDRDGRGANSSRPAQEVEGSSSSRLAAPPSLPKDKGKQREGQSLPRLSSRFLDGEFEPTTDLSSTSATNVPPPSPPPPVTTSSTTPIDGSALAQQARDADPLFSPRRRAEQLIERVSMESLRSGLGTAAYVNPLPELPPPAPQPPSDRASERTLPLSPQSADPREGPQEGRASNLLQRVLQQLAEAPLPPPRSGNYTSTAPPPPTHRPSPYSPLSAAPSIPVPEAAAAGQQTATAAQETLVRAGPTIGTTLIVQGLVTTSRPPTPAPNAPSPSTTPRTSPAPSMTSTGRALRPLPSRLARSQSTSSTATSSSAAPSAASEQPVEEQRTAPTAEEQAALLGGLLSVATAATAQSLLNNRPPRPLVPSPSAGPAPQGAPGTGPGAGGGAASTLEGIRRALSELRERSNRPPAPAPSSTTAPSPSTAPHEGDANASEHEHDTDQRHIERELRNYMSDAFGPPPPPPPATPSTGASSSNPSSLDEADGVPRPFRGVPPAPSAAARAASDGEAPVPESFERFLSEMQADLLRALREFNGLPPLDEEGIAPEAADGDTPGGDETSAAAVGSTSTPVAATSTSTAPPTSASASTATGAPPALAPGDSAQAAPLPPLMSTPAGRLSVTDGADGQPRSLNWMMVYRFEPRMTIVRAPPAALGIPADPRAPAAAAPASSDAAPSTTDGAPSSPPTAAAPGPSSAGSNAPPSPLAQLSRALLDSAAPNGAAPAQLQVLLPRRVTPMIMVGVRSVSTREIPPELGGEAAAGAGVPAPSTTAAGGQQAQAQGPRRNPSRASTRSARERTDADGDSAMSGGGRAGEGLSGRVRRALEGLRSRTPSSHSVDQSAASAGAPPASHTLSSASAEGGEPTPDTSSFILWVVGGQYPEGHPVLRAPGLFTGQMSHEELLALAELIGQAKPPTATADDISKSALSIIKGAQITQWVADGKVIASSADRCAICLEDYEPEEDCRVLSCKHVFHQLCVDSWLSKGRNACPSCRTKGVPTADDEKPAQPVYGSEGAHAAASTSQVAGGAPAPM